MAAWKSSCHPWSLILDPYSQVWLHLCPLHQESQPVRWGLPSCLRWDKLCVPLTERNSPNPGRSLDARQHVPAPPKNKNPCPLHFRLLIWDQNYCSPFQQSVSGYYSFSVIYVLVQSNHMLIGKLSNAYYFVTTGLSFLLYLESWYNHPHLGNQETEVQGAGQPGCRWWSLDLNQAVSDIKACVLTTS